MPTVRLFATALVVLTLPTACGGDSKTPPKLDGAMATIPVFAPSSLGERSDAHTSDDIGSPMKFSTYTWHLTTAQGWEPIDAYYKAQWPAAGRTEDEEQVSYRNPPLPENENTPLGESQSVTIHKARVKDRTAFEIHEDVFGEKRR